MHVLDLFSLAAPELSLTDISRQLGMHLPTAHRLVKTLEDAGLLIQAEQSDLYRLGPKLLTLGARMLDQHPVREVAGPYLRRLADELGQTVALSHYDDGEVVYLDCVQGTAPISIVCQPGARVPAHCVASGRVHLAHLDADNLDRLLARGLAPCRPELTIDAAALKAELAAVRERGYSIDDGTFRPGTLAAAAPMLDALGRPVGAIAVILFERDATMEEMHQLGRKLAALTRKISSTLGYTPPTTNGTPRPARARPSYQIDLP